MIFGGIVRNLRYFEIDINMEYNFFPFPASDKTFSEIKSDIASTSLPPFLCYFPKVRITSYYHTRNTFKCANLFLPPNNTRYQNRC